MTRGEATQTKVHYKGKNDDFIVFIDDIEAFEKWKTDKSVPMSHFIGSFDVYLTHKQGAQGIHDKAPKTVLSSEFDTTESEEVIKKILESDNIQTTKMSERQGHTNESMDAMRVK